MVIRNNWLCSSVVIAGLFCPALSHAYQLEMNTAQLQAMDKITGRVSEIEVPVNGEVKFGSFSIVVRACKATPPEETPENYAFVDVADTTKDGKLYNIFKGWMMSSSPALNAVEHPIYDVWLLKCVNKNVDKAKLLSQKSLLERDGLPKKEDIVPAETLSREALIAEEAKAEAKAAETESKVEEETSSEANQVPSSDKGEKLSSDDKNESSLLQEDDKLPVVPEIKEEKTLEKAVEPAQVIENSNSDTEAKVEENRDSNAPQPLLPNLDDNTPQPLLNIPSMEQNVEGKVEVDNSAQKAENDNAQPELLEKTIVTEAVDASQKPIVITNTVENIAEVSAQSQENTENQQVSLDEKKQPEAELQSGADIVPAVDENIPEEEDQFIEEETISQ